MGDTLYDIRLFYNGKLWVWIGESNVLSWRTIRKKPWWSSCSKSEANITGHQDHQPSLTWMYVCLDKKFGGNHLVSVLADKGKCKVRSHEESQVDHERDHLGLGMVLLANFSAKWLMFCHQVFDVSKDDGKLYFMFKARWWCNTASFWTPGPRFWSPQQHEERRQRQHMLGLHKANMPFSLPVQVKHGIVACSDSRPSSGDPADAVLGRVSCQTLAGWC